jgi:ABC-type lipoprotein export system ATPase subunit
VQLIAENVEVSYRGLPAPVLRGANFVVSTDETVAILGPSGSGKSTLLSVLGGLVRPTRGVARVRVDTAPVPRLSDVTTWILQTTNVFPERSALDNVAVAALTRGITRDEAHADAAEHLTTVGLSSRRYEPARNLSGGEVQRVVIARAMVSRRPFILADEPTGQLDQSTSRAVLDALFASIHETGLVIVTHDPAVAKRCARITRIVDGEVVDAE